MIDTRTESFLLTLRRSGLSGEPCDEFAVQDLEQTLGVSLPPINRAFLLVAGSGCEALEGSHYAIEDNLVELQRLAGRIMKHDDSDLPSDAFVFLVHQGYAFNFFFLNDGEDPPVYEYVEGLPPARRLAPRFSEWLSSEIERSRTFREGTQQGNEAT